MRAMVLVLALMLAGASAARANTNADCEQEKDRDLAIRACTLIIDGKAQGIEAAAYNNRGLAYYNKSDYGRAIADYDEAIRLDPKYAHAYINRGLAYYAKGAYVRAIADYSEAIRLDKDPAAFYSRGRIYESQGKTALAIADYRMALGGEANDASDRKARAAARDHLAALEGGEKPAQAAPSASIAPTASRFSTLTT